MDFTERSTRVYRTKQLYTKEELAARESLCVHEQPAFCAAACPLRLDARELLALAARGDLTGARAMLERATPFAGWSVQGRCLLTATGEGAVWCDEERLLRGERL